MRNIIRLIALFSLSIFFSSSWYSVVEAAYQGFEQPICVEGDEKSCIDINLDDQPIDEVAEPVLDCLEADSSCAVAFLEDLLCEFRGDYLCHGTESLKLSWGKLASIHTKTLAEFDIPSRAEIEEKTDNEDEVSDFIDYVALEHAICTLEGERLVEGEKLCINDSINAMRCFNPKWCSDPK